MLDPQLTDVSNHPLCIPGTRLAVLDQTIHWAFSDTKDNILLLQGVAGSGKSTLGLTVASRAESVGRLGARLVFRRAQTDPASVIRTLAYKLALFDASIAAHVCTAIEGNKQILDMPSIAQIDSLLIKPLTMAANSIPGPVVIVLDALDECGTPESRKNLMKVLRQALSTLPPKFRFSITDRPENDIQISFSSSSLNVRLDHTPNTYGA